MPALGQPGRRPAARRGVLAVGLAGAALAGYGGLIERNLFTLRRFAVPVLDHLIVGCSGYVSLKQRKFI